MFRYAVAEVCVVALLIFVCRVALREPPADKSGHPATVATAPPRIREVTHPLTLADNSSPETTANRLDESATTNAAAIYRQAFALYEALSNEQKQVISDWRTNVDASVEAELCEKIQPICDLMHKAAALTNCDWGVEQPITFATKLPHLARCLSIARAAVWSATHCRADDPTGAVDDLVATSRLGQNLSPALIGHLVDLTIQSRVIDAVTEHASMLAGVGDSRLVQLFNDAHYEEGLYRAIEQEADMGSAEADKLATMPPEEVTRELKGLAGNDSESQSVDTVQVIAAMRQVADLEREYTKALGSSDAEYREWLARLESIRKTNPMAQMFLPVIEQTVDRTQATTVRSAMVVAGFAVMQNGTEALQSHPDPVTGQPFVYTETADGFELQSGYQFKGAPLKLSFK
jgi:hypothetical protein